MEHRQLLSASAGSNVVAAMATPTFNITSPTSGSYTAGQAIPIQWNASQVPASSTIALCYDTDAVWGNGNETWLTVSQTAYSGAGAYTWNTTGVASGTYYVAGYLYANGSAICSHLTTPITVQQSTPSFTVTSPASGTFSAGQTVAIQWNAANVPAGSTIALCYSTANTWGQGTDHWLTLTQPATNGAGSYNWDTTGVTPGAYYLAGYLYSNGTATFSHGLEPIAIQTAPSTPTFTLLSPTSGTFVAGQTEQITWNAGNVPVGATIALCYDTDPVWGSGTETWITVSQTANNGYGSYDWNTSGVPAGQYYVAGYLYSNGTPTLSHLTQSVTVQPAPAATFAMNGPTAGVYTVGQTVSPIWTASNVPAGSTVSVCYDPDTVWNGNETWIAVDKAAINGSDSLSWNTTGVTPGTYYLAGYLYAGGRATVSHLTRPIMVAAALNVDAASAALAPLSVDQVLNSNSQLAPIVAEAIRRWSAASGGQDLANVSVKIADLPDGMLAETIGRTVLVDRDAAGYGWFVDSTPQDDAEFNALATGQLVAQSKSAADGRADLLTTVMHEMGHVLGYSDVGDGLMSGALPLSVRWPSVADGVFAKYGVG
ncbi:MAG: hypothetical protein LLG00_06860 [Planctomycetaceae bacterium]|nr:hypothetical protein [Planctomycetaceae bacterium]